MTSAAPQGDAARVSRPERHLSNFSKERAVASAPPHFTAIEASLERLREQWQGHGAMRFTKDQWTRHIKWQRAAAARAELQWAALHEDTKRERERWKEAVAAEPSSRRSRYGPVIVTKKKARSPGPELS